MRERFTIKKIALLGVLTAGALITFMIENLFPPIFIPGAKLGISNVFVLFALITLGGIEGCIVMVIKTVLASVIVGNVGSLIYGLSGGGVALIVEYLLVRYCYEKVSVVAISVTGAVLHNVVQNSVFCLVTTTVEFFSYTPYLMLIGVLGGVLVGIVTLLLIKKIPISVYDRILINNKPKENSSESEKR